MDTEEIAGTKKPAEAGFFRTRRLLLTAEATETLLELVDTTASIQNFLLTSVERVACRTYVQVHSAWLGRASLNYVTARAGCFQGSVLRMNTVFHKSPHSLRAATSRGPLSSPDLSGRAQYRYAPRYWLVIDTICPCKGNKDAHNTRAFRISKLFHVLLCCRRRSARPPVTHL